MSRWSCLVFFVFLAVCLAFSGPAGATLIQVDNSLGTLVDDPGVNQAGKCSLREAMANVSNQDGGYDDCENAGPNTDIDFVIFLGVTSITVDAAMFVGDSEVVIEGPITIDGGGNANQIFTANTSGGHLVLNLVTLQNAGASAVLVGSDTNLTANGSTFDSNSASSGGAINASTSGTVWINACSFTLNDATGNGGAIAKGVNAELFVSVADFIGNSADRGGAIYIAGTSSGEAVILDAVTFQSNDSDGTDSADGGGAIYVQATNSSSVFSIVGCIFGGPSLLGNTAERRGGAIYNNTSGFIVNSDVTTLLGGGIIACDFTNNTANGPVGADGLGGAIYNQGDMHILNSVFDSNTSTNSDGGAIGDNQMLLSRTLRISNSTFNGNSAATNGGAISMFNGIGDVGIINSTLSGNTAGGVGREVFGDGDVDLSNTIISNSSSGANCAGGGTFTDSGGNLLYDTGNTASCGLSSGGDPLLGSLTLNIGPLPVRTMDLGGTSPALGAGSSGVCGAFPVLSLDARGIPRPTVCDIGAFEGGDTARLVINEIDYDQGGTDDHEFIEIMNAGSEGISLDNVAIQLVDGTGGGAVEYASIDLPAVNLGPGGFYVVCGQTGSGLPLAHCDHDVTPDTDLIQDGNGGSDPDAVALRLSGVLVDTVSYEGDTGWPYTEGSGVGLEDNPAEMYFSISRASDGADSDGNNVDFGGRCNSPGLANLATTTSCDMVPVELLSFVIE